MKSTLCEYVCRPTWAPPKRRKLLQGPNPARLDPIRHRHGDRIVVGSRVWNGLDRDAIPGHGRRGYPDMGKIGHDVGTPGTPNRRPGLQAKNTLTTDLAGGTCSANVHMSSLARKC